MMMKTILLFVQSILYILAGVNHFWHPKFYLIIMPPWLPSPHTLVILSGIAEIVCGILLLVPATRIVGAWCLVALLIVIFPANIQMLLNFIKMNNSRTWVAVVRLPLQLLLIYWAYQYTRPPAAG